MERHCSIKSCSRKHYGKGLCSKHFQRYKRTGKPEENGWFSSKEISTRYWNKVEKTVGCWRWLGAKTTFGYGQLYDGLSKKAEGAHRVSWRIHNGDIPDGLHVLHKCDNPECTNPEHLFLGTQADNMIDKATKGRAYGSKLKGEEVGNSVLDFGKVVKIKKLIMQGHSGRSIASLFGVSESTVSLIKKEKSWKHVLPVDIIISKK